jgi:ketosteroid isomerase-like protein
MSTKASPRAVVELYYSLVDSADYAGVVALFSTNATYRRPGYPLIRGRAALLDFYQRTRVIRSGHHNLGTIIESGPIVAVTGTFVGSVADGRHVSQDFADFFTVRGGLIVARQTYFDSAAI